MPKKPTPPKKPPPKAARRRPLVPRKHARIRLPPAERLLTPQESIFVREYLVDLNASRAARDAGYSPITAKTRASSWVLEDNAAKPHVAIAVKLALAQRASRLEITADLVLKRWWTIATADARELIQYHRYNCRYCWGKGHGYQWTTKASYDMAVQHAAAKQTTPPSCDGGFGFDRTADPNPGCPECRGRGEGDLFLTDTRQFSPSAAMLYAGTKISQGGVQVLMEDRSAALERVARHLGMLDPKLKLKLGGDPENPLQLLLQQISGGALKPVALDPDHEDGSG